jgi:hypothetical protein
VVTSRQVRVVLDTIALTIPNQLNDLSGEATREVALAELNEQTISWVWRQYRGRARPLAIEKYSVDWLLSDSLEDVDGFKLAHDCAECRAGVAKARAWLAEHPGRHVALGNVRYTEVWVE